jgi:hypothetical protein
MLTLICQPVLAERALAALIAVERALSTVESLLSHTPPWMLQGTYRRVCHYRIAPKKIIKIMKKLRKNYCPFNLCTLEKISDFRVHCIMLSLITGLTS